MKITSDEVDSLRYNSIFLTKILYHKAHKTDCRGSLIPVPYSVTHLYDHKLLVCSANDNLFHSQSRFHWHVVPECRFVYSQCTQSHPGSCSWQRTPVWSHFSSSRHAKQWTYVDGILEPVILQLSFMRPWIVVALMYQRLPPGNFWCEEM